MKYPSPIVFFTPIHPPIHYGNLVSGIKYTPLIPFPYLFFPTTFVSENNVQYLHIDGMVVETSSTRQLEGEVRPLLESTNDHDFQR